MRTQANTMPGSTMSNRPDDDRRLAAKALPMARHKVISAVSKGFAATGTAGGNTEEAWPGRPRIVRLGS